MSTPRARPCSRRLRSATPALCFLIHLAIVAAGCGVEGPARLAYEAPDAAVALGSDEQGLFTTADPADPSVNAALGKPATQSSTGWGGTAGRAVDDNRDGTQWTHTSTASNSWWEVDLQGTYLVHKINIYNRTDCCGERLVGATVKLLNARREVLAQSTVTSAGRLFEWRPSAPQAARYLRVEQATNYLSLSEVEAWAFPSALVNVAEGKPATQSALYAANHPASAGVDGSLNGNWSTPPIVHTTDASSYWEVDLGSELNPRYLILHNRTDCCADRMIGAQLQLLGRDRALRDALTVTDAQSRYFFRTAASKGVRYVRLQKQGILNFGELEVLVDPSAPPLVLLPAHGQSGSVQVDHNWRRRTFAQEMTAPVVIAGPSTRAGSDPICVRLQNVQASGFDVRVQEWKYLDGTHAVEDVPFLALEPGRYVMPDGAVWEVGRVAVSGDRQWVRARLSGGTTTPHVFTTMQTFAASDPATVRVRNVSSTGFDLAIFEQDLVDGAHAQEQIGYLAIYQPAGRGRTLRDEAYNVSRARIGDAWLAIGGGRTLFAEEEKSLHMATTHVPEDVDMLDLQGRLFAQIVSARELDNVTLRTPAGGATAWQRPDNANVSTGDVGSIQPGLFESGTWLSVPPSLAIETGGRIRVSNSALYDGDWEVTLAQAYDGQLRLRIAPLFQGYPAGYDATGRTVSAASGASVAVLPGDSETLLGFYGAHGGGTIVRVLNDLTVDVGGKIEVRGTTSYDGVWEVLQKFRHDGLMGFRIAAPWTGFPPGFSAATTPNPNLARVSVTRSAAQPVEGPVFKSMLLTDSGWSTTSLGERVRTFVADLTQAFNAQAREARLPVAATLMFDPAACANAALLNARYVAEITLRTAGGTTLGREYATGDVCLDQGRATTLATRLEGYAGAADSLRMDVTVVNASTNPELIADAAFLPHNLLRNGAIAGGSMHAWSTNGSWAVVEGRTNARAAQASAQAQRSQEVDLLASGLTASYLDSTPPLYVHSWFTGRQCSEAVMRLELLDQNRQLLWTWNLQDDLDPSTCTAGWLPLGQVLTDYPAGVRYARFTDGGPQGARFESPYFAAMPRSYQEDRRRATPDCGQFEQAPCESNLGQGIGAGVGMGATAVGIGGAFACVFALIVAPVTLGISTSACVFAGVALAGAGSVATGVSLIAEPTLYCATPELEVRGDLCLCPVGLTWRASFGDCIDLASPPQATSDLDALHHTYSLLLPGAPVHDAGQHALDGIRTATLTALTGDNETNAKLLSDAADQMEYVVNLTAMAKRGPWSVQLGTPPAAAPCGLFAVYRGVLDSPTWASCELPFQALCFSATRQPTWMASATAATWWEAHTTCPKGYVLDGPRTQQELGALESQLLNGMPHPPKPLWFNAYGYPTDVCLGDRRRATDDQVRAATLRFVVGDQAGSGVLVLRADGRLVILTAAHVIDLPGTGDHEGFFPQDDADYQILVGATTGNLNIFLGGAAFYTHPAWNNTQPRGHDIAVIVLPDYQFIHHDLAHLALPIDALQGIAPPAGATGFGFPGGQWVEGAINAIQASQHAPVFWMSRTALAAHGMSGGPVLAGQHVVALVEGGGGDTLMVPFATNMDFIQQHVPGAGANPQSPIAAPALVPAPELNFDAEFLELDALMADLQPFLGGQCGSL